MSPAPPRMPATGDVLVDRFRVDSVLGKGDAGQVFGARRVSDDVAVVIKVMNVDAGARPDAVPRFLAEVRAAAELESPYLVKVFEAGTLDSGLPFAVMERLEGTDLAALLQRRGRLPIAESADYVTQAGEALVNAHAAGLVHRGIKASNLFLASGAEAGESRNVVKVLDFGASQISERRPGLSPRRRFLGSLGYMAPEQLYKATEVDARADVWSLGVVLYELVAGRRPFEGKSEEELVRAIATRDFTPLRSTRRVPQRLDEIISRCLRKEPGERFASASELIAALTPLAPPDAAAHARRAQIASLRSDLWLENPLPDVPPDLEPTFVVPEEHSVPVDLAGPEASSPPSYDEAPPADLAGPETSSPLSYHEAPGSHEPGSWPASPRRSKLVVMAIAVAILVIAGTVLLVLALRESGHEEQLPDKSPLGLTRPT